MILFKMLMIYIIAKNACKRIRNSCNPINYINHIFSRLQFNAKNRPKKLLFT